MTDVEAAQLRTEVATLRVLVGSLSARLETLEHPMSRGVFVVQKTGDAWQEQGVESGAFVDYSAGRSGNGTGTQALLDLSSGCVAVIEERDGDHCRYIVIGGVPPPTAANQVLISKEDPDNPGTFIWEVNWGRWHA